MQGGAYNRTIEGQALVSVCWNIGTPSARTKLKNHSWKGHVRKERFNIVLAKNRKQMTKNNGMIRTKNSTKTRQLRAQRLHERMV